MPFKRRFIFLFIISFSSFGFAKESWLCTQTASQEIGSNTYLVCGTASSASEADARKFSLENAINEFRGFCEVSANCRSRKVNFTPKRTSCEQINSGFRCYRALEVTLGKRIQSADMLSSAELKREILLRRKQLSEAQERESNLRKLEAIKEQVRALKLQSQKNVEKAEIELYEQKYMALSYDSLTFYRGKMGLSGGPIKGQSLTMITFGGGASYLPKPYFRITGDVNFLTGVSGEKLYGSSDYEHQFKGLEAHSTIGYSLAPFWIDVGLGYMTGTYEHNDYKYISGVRTSEVILVDQIKTDFPFYSAQVEYERSVMFFTLEYRGYLSSDSQTKVKDEVRLYIGGKW